MSRRTPVVKTEAAAAKAAAAAAASADAAASAPIAPTPVAPAAAAAAAPAAAPAAAAPAAAFAPKAPARRRAPAAEAAAPADAAFLAGPQARPAFVRPDRKAAPANAPPPTKVAFMAPARAGASKSARPAGGASDLSAAELQALRSNAASDSAAYAGYGVKAEGAVNAAGELVPDGALDGAADEADMTLPPLYTPFAVAPEMQPYTDGFPDAPRPVGLPAYRDPSLPEVVAELREQAERRAERAAAAAEAAAAAASASRGRRGSNVRVKAEPGSAGAAADAGDVVGLGGLLPFQSALSWLHPPAAAMEAAGTGPYARFPRVKPAADDSKDAAAAPMHDGDADLVPTTAPGKPAAAAAAAAAAAQSMEDDESSSSSSSAPVYERGELFLVQLPAALPILPPSKRNAAAAAAAAAPGVKIQPGTAPASAAASGAASASGSWGGASSSASGSASSASASGHYDAMLAHDEPVVVDDATVKTTLSAAALAKEYKLFTAQSEDSVKHVPAGRVGELIVYKSGKVKLRLGDNTLLTVSRGVRHQCASELVSITSNERGGNDLHVLGAVDKSLVCALDVDDIVRRAARE